MSWTPSPGKAELLEGRTATARPLEDEQGPTPAGECRGSVGTRAMTRAIPQGCCGRQARPPVHSNSCPSSPPTESMHPALVVLVAVVVATAWAVGTLSKPVFCPVGGPPPAPNPVKCSPGQKCCSCVAEEGWTQGVCSPGNSTCCGGTFCPDAPRTACCGPVYPSGNVPTFICFNSTMGKCTDTGVVPKKAVTKFMTCG